jgi:hypothetical protein
MDISRNPFTVVIEDDTETTIEFTGAILPKLLEAPRQSMYFKVTAGPVQMAVGQAITSEDPSWITDEEGWITVTDEHKLRVKFGAGGGAIKFTF